MDVLLKDQAKQRRASGFPGLLFASKNDTPTKILTWMGLVTGLAPTRSNPDAPQPPFRKKQHKHTPCRVNSLRLTSNPKDLRLLANPRHVVRAAVQQHQQAVVHLKLALQKS